MINSLIKSGYEFRVEAGDSINYGLKNKLLYKEAISEYEAIMLLGQIKDNKQEALAYMNTIIKLSVNSKAGNVSGTYKFYVHDITGKQIYSHTLDNTTRDIATSYVNKNFAKNKWFKYIISFYSKSRGIQTCYLSDSRRVGEPATEHRQIQLSCTAGRELTPSDPEYHQCPWG